MNLLITYMIAVCVMIFGSVWLGVIVDRMTSPFVSLMVFFPVFFGGIWLTWKLAVKLTEPKANTSA